MKRIFAGLMCVVIVLSLCGCSGLFNPNKETEAEYKARIKKELDAIPVEATGYKLCAQDKGESNYSYEEIVENVILKHSNISFVETTIGLHVYNARMTLYADDIDKDWRNEEYGMEISVDGGEVKRVNFNYKEEYTNFGCADVVVYDEKVFVIRGRGGRGWTIRYDNYFPDTLFLYDYESNTLKYMGYQEEWFDFPISKFNKYVNVVKIRDEEE